ncbi:dymeclin-like [Saccoglossus kowalevskii]|uniref:Dymeclin n=1 Tax=Saccoglossus kowalevskii TaxID=10224 RepID=A0ABM0GJF1_SACKO|nr:PREDICTED: dymeclin-like [Saccoglossus kowalevskii]
MGANSSSISELSKNEHLKRLAGKDVLSENDPFWNQLLSFSFCPPQTSADNRLLMEQISPICKVFAENNLQTGNFCALVNVFLMRCVELKASTQCENDIFTWQTHNALFIIRCLISYFIENMSEGGLLREFAVKDIQQGNQTGEPLLEKFIDALIHLLIEVPVVNFTYVIHLEATNLLLTLLSVQLFIPRIAHKSIFFQYLMQGKCSKDACPLVKTLLDHIIKHEPCPPEALGGSHAGSMLYGFGAAVASGLWSMVTLGYGGRSAPPDDEDRAILANQSLLLLLVLANHYTHEKGMHNPYRQALCTFGNLQDSAPSSPTSPMPVFRMNLTGLYDAFCKHMKSDQMTLLLYLLLHRNSNIRAYILSRTNIEQLVVPILKILYSAQERNSHHIYMALIILLIMSEDDAFNKSVHELIVRNITWYTERSITEITLGGLIVLVVIRTIQYNMTRMRDKYLHTNCLAALANMSSQFHSLHPYVTQRIVSLFELLSKKHAKILEHLRNSPKMEHNNQNDDRSSTPDYATDLAVLEEVIRMVLEIVNSCLTNTLHHNPNLIYTLLYKKDLFVPFRTHPTFQDIIQNIDTVLNYFTSKLEQHGTSNLSVHQVLDVIKQAILQWPRDRLKKFPELKFKYVEEDQPEEFFIPYVWSLVFHSSNLYWNSDKIELFTLNS